MGQSLVDITNINQYLMVDIVVNHNAWNGDASSVNYSTFVPFDKHSDYHSHCSIDYDNITSVQGCWLGDSNVELPDLATEASNVVEGYQTWIDQLVSDYSSECALHHNDCYQRRQLSSRLVDGLRIDTAKHVDSDFWFGF